MSLIETTASSGLLPYSYREAIKDGKRRIERQTAFDADRHQMRLTSGGTSMTLPLAVAARDPLTALFYIRGLPMEAGSHVALPLNDNGRRLTLEVSIGGVEHNRARWAIEDGLEARATVDGSARASRPTGRDGVAQRRRPPRASDYRGDGRVRVGAPRTGDLPRPLT